MPGSGLEALARAVRLQPENEVALRDYGVDLHEAGRIEEARPLLERAVELDPTDQEAHAALGRAYASRTTGPEDLKRAVEAFRTALQLQPGDVQTRFRLARLWYQSDDLEKARGEFETTLSLLAEGGRRTLDPMDGRTVQSVTWISLVKGCHHHLAQIAARQKRAAEAARHRRLFDAMEQYVHQTYYLFNDLKARPDDPVARRRLSELFVRFGFPASGPDGPAAAARWIGG
jgi:tetratricopeptide (TPR) repeat protein